MLSNLFMLSWILTQFTSIHKFSAIPTVDPQSVRHKCLMSTMQTAEKKIHKITMWARAYKSAFEIILHAKHTDTHQLRLIYIKRNVENKFWVTHTHSFIFLSFSLSFLFATGFYFNIKSNRKESTMAMTQKSKKWIWFMIRSCSGELPTQFLNYYLEILIIELEAKSRDCIVRQKVNENATF